MAKRLKGGNRSRTSIKSCGTAIAARQGGFFANRRQVIDRDIDMLDAEGNYIKGTPSLEPMVSFILCHKTGKEIVGMRCRSLGITYPETKKYFYAMGADRCIFNEWRSEGYLIWVRKICNKMRSQLKGDDRPNQGAQMIFNTLHQSPVPYGVCDGYTMLVSFRIKDLPFPFFRVGPDMREREDWELYEEFNDFKTRILAAHRLFIETDVIPAEWADDKWIFHKAPK